MSSRDRLAEVLDRIADRLDALDASISGEHGLRKEVADLTVKVTIVTADHDGELQRLSSDVRALQRAAGNGAA